MTEQELIIQQELEYCDKMNKEINKLKGQLYECRTVNKRASKFSKRNGSR